MAKTPPTVEYFNVVIGNVATADLGATMAALAKLGHTNVRPELVTEVHRFRQKQAHDVNAENFLAEWIVEHPQFKAKEVVTHFDLHGRTAGAAYTSLRVLTEKGILKKLGDGLYARKDAYLPKSKQAKTKAAKPAKQQHRKSHVDFALDLAAKNGGRLVRIDLVSAMVKAKRPPQSVSSVFRDLMKAEKIERVEEGVYKLLKSRGNGAAVEASNG